MSHDLAIPATESASLEFSADGNQLALSQRRRVVLAWNLADGKPVPALQDGTYRGIGVSAVTFSPIGLSAAALGLGDASAGWWTC